MIDSGNLDVKIVRRGGIGMVKQFPFTLPVTKESNPTGGKSRFFFGRKQLNPFSSL